MGWTRAPIRELPGERDAFRVGTVLNVVLIGILLVVTIVSGIVATPGAFLVAIPLAFVEAWFVVEMVRHVRRPPFARMPVLTDVAELVLVEALRVPVDPAWIAGIVRLDLDDGDDVRDAVLSIVERLLRDGHLLAGRVDSGTAVALGDGEVLDELTADAGWLGGSGSGIRFVLSPVGREVAPRLRDAHPLDASTTRAPLVLVGDPGVAWREAADRVGSRLLATDASPRLLAVLREGVGARVGPAISSLEVLTVSVGLPALAPRDPESALTARLRDAVDLVEDVGFARGDLDVPLDGIRGCFPSSAGPE